MKRKIELWEEAGHILEHVGKGVLITAAADGKVNPMTIGWGTLGIQWGKPIFIAFVRESRYTMFAASVTMQHFTKRYPVPAGKGLPALWCWKQSDSP